MTYEEELTRKEQEVKDLLRFITNISDNLMNGELTLADIIAEEESLENRCYELQEALKDIIHLRQLIDFENCKRENFSF